MGWFSKRFTNETLRDRVAQLLGPDYTVRYDAQGIGVHMDGELIAYSELGEDGRDATVAFSAIVWPAYAAEIALAFNDILPTYVDIHTGFVANEMAEIREVT